MSLAETGVQRLRATVKDGRCRNIRYRQKQLESLYNAVSESASGFCDAISKDSQSTTTEVEAEFSMTMSALRSLYDGLDFDKDLGDEYSVTKGKDYSTRRLGVGLVVIRPTNHTRFHSVLTAVATAVAAGNCVILELEDSLLETDSLLKELLPKSLDHDSFFISSSKISEEELKSSALVDQRSSTSLNASSKDVLSSSTTRVIAVVDRTANVDAAACCLVGARSRFQSTSPYAPDLILVNEFVKKEFIEACMRYVTTQFVTSGPKGSQNNAKQRTQDSIREAEKKRELATFGSSDFMVVDISNRNTAVATMKITGSYLVIMPCTSMTDAVSSQSSDEIFLAGYFFGSVEAAKFLSQHIECHMSFLNQIPVHLLVGPAAPITHTPGLPGLPNRYNTDMFSVPRPQFVGSSSGEMSEISRLIEKPTTATLRQLRSLAVAPLNAKKQPLGKAIGFFEQGILLGLGIAASIIIPILGFGAYTIVRKSLLPLVRKSWR